MKKVLAFFSLLFTFLFAETKIEKGIFEYEGKNYECIKMENEKLQIKIIPSLGGRVAEIIDKTDNTNVVKFGNYGGFLDDHEGRTIEKYEYEITKSTKDIVSLKMWNEKNDIKYTKILTIYSNNPLIEIEYEILNKSQEELGKVMIRNSFTPGGEVLSEDDIYITPMEYGIIKKPAPYKEREKIGAPWKGFVNIKKKKGIVIYFEDDYLCGFYDWIGSITSRTFEWYYKALPPGKGVRTKFYFILTNGFDDYSYINKFLVANTKIDGQNIYISVMPLWNDFKNLKIETKILNFNREKISELEGTKIDYVKIGDIFNVKRQFNFDIKKNYIIYHQIFSEGKEVGKYEAVVENVKDNYSTKPVFEKNFSFFDIHGWKKLVVEPEIKNDDLERGYIIYSNTNKNHIKEINIDLGIGEFESYELILRPLKEIGKIKILYPEKFSKNIEIKIGEVLTTEIWKKKVYGQKLIKTDNIDCKKDMDSHIWLILNSKELTHGKYKIEFSFKPENAKEEKLFLNLNVWNIKFPEEQPLFVFTPNTLFNYFCVDKVQSPMIAEWEWNFKKATPYAEDLYQHGVRNITGYSWHNVGYGYKYVYIRENGKKLIESKGEINENNLPKLDFAKKWDPYIHFIIDSGFTQYHTTLGNIKSYYENFSDIAKFLNIDKDKLRIWYLKEIADYFKEKGFEKVYSSIDDEIPADKFPAWVEIGKEVRNLGFAPGCTWSNLLLENEEYIKLISSVCDYWTIGTYNPENIEKNINKGYIEKTDYLQTYVSSATWWQRYEDMRFHCGWLPSYGGLKGTWIQEYWRWNQDACIIFPSEKGPIVSSAWEGARDGFEDANYYILAKTLLNIAEKNVSNDKIKNLKTRFRKIIGYDEDCILKVKRESTRLGTIITYTKTPDEDFRKAKKELLSIISEVKKYLPSTKPDVYFHQIKLINQGKPLFKIIYQEEKEPSLKLRDYIYQKSDVKIPVLKYSNKIDEFSILLVKRGEKIIETIKKQFPEIIEGVTDFYPPEKSYIIKQNKNIILIFGNDKEGLETGIKNFSKFIKVSDDYWKKYYLK